MRRHDTYPPFLSLVVVCQDDAPCPHGGCRPSSSRDPTREPAGGHIFRGRGPRHLSRFARRADSWSRIEVWAYCLMPNHVHLILTPTRVDGLGLAVGEAHRRYTNFINARGRWTGHLFQRRFASVAMDEAHLMAAVCYVNLNPVRARLVSRAEDGLGRAHEPI